MRHTQIEEHIANFKTELSDLLNYPRHELVDIIQEVGFSCTCCGQCCTAAFNGHIYLLPDDMKYLRSSNSDLLVPAPGFEISDREGRMYASSYALQMSPDGTCPYLQNGRCVDYENRFSICRVYPYMLHHEADEEGNYDFRQISGLNQHGEYHYAISNKEANEIADMVYAYEQAYLEHMIQFYQFMHAFFTENKLRYSRQAHDKMMRIFYQGGEIDIFVYESDSLVPHRVSLQSYNTHFNL